MESKSNICLGTWKVKYIKPGKVSKDGCGFKVYIKDFTRPSFYKLIYHWFNINHLWYKNELYIFPKIIMPTKTFPIQTMDFHQNASRPWFLKQIISVNIAKFGL